MNKENQPSSVNIAIRIRHDLDTSVVIPILSSEFDYCHMLDVQAQYFNGNGVEIILVVPISFEISTLVNHFVLNGVINWKLVKVSSGHETGLMPLFEAGIRSSNKNKILLLDINCWLTNDVIFECNNLLIDHINHFFVFFQNQKLNSLPNGCLVNRTELQSLFKEGLVSTNGSELNNVISGLTNKSITKYNFDNGICRSNNSYTQLQNKNHLLDILNCISKKGTHGTTSPKQLAFTILFDYLINDLSLERCNYYIKQFLQYQVFNETVFQRQFGVIALIQTYNERKNIPEVLDHLSKYCDGIILLDDESTDNTYEFAENEKLILKVKKQRNNTFDDLQNRNILLDLASFFSAEWLLFMDADERFADDFVLETSTIPVNYSIVAFPLVHMWGSINHYWSNKAFIPGFPEGVVLRKRMFKPKSRMQIHAEKKLHFVSIPYISPTFIYPQLIKHLGTLQESDREKKYGFYKAVDENWEQHKDQYEFLTDRDIRTRSISEFDMEVISRLNTIILPSK